VDFLIRKGNKPRELVQVCASLDREETRKREIESLLSGMKRSKINQATVVTLSSGETIRNGRFTIHVVPAAEWLARP
jgi:predicted AAA+ superfamily ATPase